MFLFNLIVLYSTLKLFLCIKHSFALQAFSLSLQKEESGWTLIFRAYIRTKDGRIGVMDISCAIFEWFVRIGHFVCWSRRSVLQGV